MFVPEDVARRYSETAEETDKYGRVVVVGRLRPAQQLRASEMAGNDTAATTIRFVAGLVKIIDPDGEVSHFGFPKNRAELDARMDRLDDEGIDALVKATIKLYPKGDGDDGAKSVPEQAKNS